MKMGQEEQYSVVYSSLTPQVVAFAWREGTSASVCRLSKGFRLLDRTKSPFSSLLGPFYLGYLSRAWRFAPRRFRYWKSLLRRWFRSAAGEWFGRVCRVLVYLVTLRLPLIETPRPNISQPLSAARGHNSTRTAIIFVCVDSFIQVLTAKYGMLTLPSVTRSHARDIHITGLVTASAAIILAGFSSRSG